VQARSLEIYDQLGLGDRILKEAHRAVAVAPGFLARVFGRVPLGALGAGLTPYPYIEMLEQSRNEEILYENLRALGADVRWETAVTALAQTEDGVTAKVGNDTVEARFCVGCDGSNSAVRRARRIAYEGVTNPHQFYVIDAGAVAGLVADTINVRPGRDEFMLGFPMSGRGNFRLIGQMHDTDGAGELAEEEVRGRLRREFAVTYGETRWFATYKVHHRVAAAFRDGPFFLAGDAAHVHSPVGGQGMNTGLQDAHNLAFKLVDVLRGRRKDTWLDRYEAERRPVARTLVATTDRVFGLITSPSRSLRLVRRIAVPLLVPLVIRLAPRSAAGSRLFQYVAQIRIHYWMTPGVSGGRRDPVIGRRLPWTGENFAALRPGPGRISPPCAHCGGRSTRTAGSSRVTYRNWDCPPTSSRRHRGRRSNRGSCTSYARTASWPPRPHRPTRPKSSPTPWQPDRAHDRSGRRSHSRSWPGRFPPGRSCFRRVESSVR
jgi:2-polyprenyl-6-methoxyphenol hydroxylase-like FAD-dependent oxidoreductase